MVGQIAKGRLALLGVRRHVCFLRIRSVGKLGLGRYFFVVGMVGRGTVDSLRMCCPVRVNGRRTKRLLTLEQKSWCFVALQEWRAFTDISPMRPARTESQAENRNTDQVCKAQGCIVGSMSMSICCCKACCSRDDTSDVCAFQCLRVFFTEQGSQDAEVKTA